MLELVYCWDITLRMRDSQGKKARWRMVKPRLGLAGGVLFKANCQGVPIITQPSKERKIREHNSDMTETRAARVEQNTRHKAEPSTLYQVYRCINKNKRYCDIPTKYPCSNMEQTSSPPATSNAIRGPEQSGNIAKQRFARTRWVRGLTWQYGRHDIASGRYCGIGIAIYRATSKQR